MPNRLRIITVSAVLLTSVFVAGAQQAGKTPNIGILRNDTPALFASRDVALRQGLRELGYFEGKNIRLVYRYAEGKEERLPQLAAELVGLGVDIIVVGGGTLDAARKATTTIPIVVGSAGDLVGSGYAASLANPGGNITGSTDISPDVSGKRLELLKEIRATASRIAVFVSPKSKGDLRELKETETVAPHLGVKIQRIDMRGREHFAENFAAMTKQRADGVIFIQGGRTLPHRKELSELAIKHRLPSMCETSVWTVDGCLMNYGPDLIYLWRRAAIYVDKILKGRTPAELPVEQPMKFDFVVNLKTANELGITIPQWTLMKADRVIK